jgi:aminopeptidase N
MSHERHEHGRILECGHRAQRHAQHARAAREPFALPGTPERFAPDRSVDVLHTRLELALDPRERRIEGIAHHTVAALDEATSRVRLHAEELEIRRVTDGAGRALAFRHVGADLDVELAEPLALGASAVLSIAYAGTPRRGLYFVAPDADYPKKPHQAWTQGQDEDAKYWFPCFDHPSEKASSEVLVRVPAQFQALSNGELVGRTPHEDGTETWHWRQALPHAAYLVTLVVGAFEQVVLAEGRVPLTAWVPPGQGARAKAAFGRTAKMLEVFERRFGVAFPWEKYAQVVVEDFIFGGMENTSATTLIDLALYDERAALDYDADDLVAHELAHQWWGDLLTCRDWSHAWLNEGFATWCETVFKEEHLGAEEAAYERHTQRLGYLDEDGGEYRRAIVDRRWQEPIDLFDRHLYEKGACVLHMLRKELGEDAFWRAIRTYAGANRGGSVVTEDLLRAVQQATGRNLEWFFDQWVFHGGHPELTVSWTHDEKRGELALTVKQGQAGDALTPEAFRFQAEVELVFAGGRRERHVLEITRRDHTLHVPCERAPERVRFDPEGDLLATIEVSVSADVQRKSLADDPSAVLRLRAAQALAKDPSDATVEALGRALSDRFWGVAAEAASALARIRTPAARERLVQGLQRAKHPKARRAVAAALGAFRHDAEAAEALQGLLEHGDPSLFVEGAAAAALGATRVPAGLRALEKALATKDSWAEQIRIGCVRGLGALGGEEAVPLLLGRIARGHVARLRAAAAGALAQAGRRLVNREAVREALQELLRDPSFPVVMAAIGALRVLGDERALGALHALAESGADGRVRRAALVAAGRLGRGAERTQEVARLSDDLDKVRRANHDLLARLDRLEARVTGKPVAKPAAKRAGKTARKGAASTAPRRARRKGSGPRRRSR